MYLVGICCRIGCSGTNICKADACHDGYEKKIVPADVLEILPNVAPSSALFFLVVFVLRMYAKY